MAQDRLSGSDKRTLALWILCGIIGIVLAQKYFFRAFPEASVDFKISRTAAQSRAKQFVESLGENLGGYQSTVVFDVDEQAKTYLERELGLQLANRVMAKELSIWYWDVRFFKPQQEEEFRVRVSPAGGMVGYEHKIEEARGSPSLTRQQARIAAETYLQANLGTDLDRWEFLPEEENSRNRPNRIDWSFTWQRKDFKAKDAPYRLQVALQGDHIGGSQQFLRVPEAWTRSYEHLRSTNNLYESIALIPYGFLLGAALWLGISLWRQGKTSWSTAFAIGGVVTVLFFLMQLNDWGSVRAGYDTQYSYASFVLRALLSMLLGAVATAITISLVYPGGEPLYRASEPERLRLPRAFTSRGIRSKEFFCASVVGLSLAAVHIGFVVVFYIVANHFGAWAPQDINFSDIVNTPFPWIAGVAIGVLASTNEEFTFRLFAIPFMHKLTGSRVLAIILPAFFWSFLHSNYPQEPAYIRGLEIGLMGIVAGLVMWRWGIVATLVWHYTVDASLVGLFLIRSDNLYFKISGLIVGLAAVVPLAFSGVCYLVRGSFEDLEDLLNRAEPAPEISLARQSAPEQAAAAERHYDALTTGALGFLAVCLVVGGILAATLKRDHIGDYLEISADREEATRLADEVMREEGFNPAGYRKSAIMVDTTDPVVNEFLRRRMSIADINKIYAQRIPGALWRVRYFRDLQPEEFAVTLKPDGSLHGFWHTLAEAAKGANLSKDDAEALAELYLTQKKHIDLKDWKLVEANSDKRPNRTDTTLVWQHNAPLDPQNSGANGEDHAYARLSVTVLGDQLADYRTYIKIPEEFQRKMGEQTVGRILVRIGQICLGLGLVLSVLAFFFKRLRTQPVRVQWRKLLGWGLIGIGGLALSFAFGSSIPALLQQYPTSMPMRIFLSTAGVGIFLLGAVALGILVLLYGLAWTFAARAFGDAQLPSWLGMPREYYRDAFWLGVGGAAAIIGLQHLIEFVARWWPTLHREAPANFARGYDAFFPGIGIAGSMIYRSLFAVGILMLAGAFVGAEVRARWLRLFLFLAIAAGMVTSWGSPADLLKQFLASAILLAVVGFGMQRLVRFNLLGLFLVVSLNALLAGASELLSQPNAFYRLNGYVIVFIIVLLLGWPLLIWRLRGQTQSAA